MTTEATMEAVPGSPAAVAINHLSKTFPGQRALIDVDFTVRPAEVHALLGQNGSGKSTLIKILAGIYKPDPGAEIVVGGEHLKIGSPRESARLGLRFVHQTLGIIGELTAVENVALGTGYLRIGRQFVDWRAQRAKTRRLLALLGVDVDIECPVNTLRPVERSAIAIARALDTESGVSRVLVLDEPTAALPHSEVDALFSLVEQARNVGTSVIYVTHRLQEVERLADRATVLRDGRVRGVTGIREIDRDTMVNWIVGGELAASLPDHLRTLQTVDERPVVLAIRGLASRRIHSIDFTLRQGEILGVAGLTGSGREEMARALVGAIPSRVRLVTKDDATIVDPSPRQAMRRGVCLVLPGGVPGAGSHDLTVRENITLPEMRRYSRAGFIRYRDETDVARHWIKALDIRPNDPERALRLLSGGNQQKVVFSKWLSLRPDVLILDEPTSGVDVGAREAIYELIRNEAASGKAFIVCSSDTEDLLAVCTRVIVLDSGLIKAELAGAEVDESRIVQEMIGGGVSAGA